MSQSSLPLHPNPTWSTILQVLQVFTNDQKEMTAEKNDKEVKEKEGGLSVIRDRFYNYEVFDE